MTDTRKRDRSPGKVTESAAGNCGRRRRPKLTVRSAKLTAVAVFVLLLAALLCFGPNGWLVGSSSAHPGGGTITNGSAQGLPPGFLFEPEVPLASLKTAPTWNELEQLLDNPYAVGLCSSIGTGLMANTPGNDQGYPSYCSTVIRRQSFLPGGAALPPFLVHPLNYNPTTGERMRLLNPNYPETLWTFQTLDPNPQIVDPCPSAAELNGMLVTQELMLSSGAARMAPDAHEIDYNSPITADTIRCVPNLEPPEVGFLLGGDPGEPTGYSVSGTNGTAPTLRLRNPQTGANIPARSTSSGSGGLQKPSLRVPEAGGSPSNPNYLVNSDLELTVTEELTPSNENDYVRDRNAAMALGKSVFWDMQLGSDGVQSCGTCHFHAGADNRTKNQMNPNHLSGDVTFQVRQPNEDLTASDFPFHKLANPDIAGDPKCATPIVATINPGVLENNLPNGGSV